MPATAVTFYALCEVNRPRDRLSAQVTLEEIRQAQRAEKEQEKIKKSMKARMDFLDLD